MTDVLLRALALLLVLLAGIAMRSSRLVGDDAGQVVKQFVFYLTLPAVIIVNFAKIPHVGVELLAVVFIGAAVDFVMLYIAAFLTRRRSREDKVLYLFSLPAYNVGAFCIPFVQSFLPPLGAVVTCMFDMGNSILCTGGSYALVSQYVSAQRPSRFDFRFFISKLLSSPPIITYMVMTGLTICGLGVPDGVITLLQPAVSANAFMAMLMLGLLFRLELKREYLGELARLVLLRLGFAVCLAVLCWALPFEKVVRQALMLVAFSPMSALAPAYTGMCGGDAGKASAANALSVLCALPFMTAILLFVEF